MCLLRILLVVASLAALAACESDKYSKMPYPSGPWTPANAHPNTDDNNIVPYDARGDAS